MEVDCVALVRNRSCSHYETILTGLLPLSRILMAERKPLQLRMNLKNTSGIPPGPYVESGPTTLLAKSEAKTSQKRDPFIELSIQDLTQERLSWSKVIDVFKGDDEGW